jgi:hypothetical protein
MSTKTAHALADAGNALTDHAAQIAAVSSQTEDAPAPMVFDESDRIVIGTPCYGGNVKMGFMTSYNETLLHVRIRVRNEQGEVELQPLVAESMFLDKESHIDRARNKIACKFLATKYNWLLYIDADIVFPGTAVARLWQHGMVGHKIVTAPYALKGVVPQFAINGLAGAKIDERGLVEVVHAGTGFMLIHRSVFDKIREAGLAPEYNLGSNDPDVHTLKTSRAYFKSGVREVMPGNPIWLSEDYMLCHEWRKLGGKIHTDTKVALSHIGDLTYPANPKEIFAAVGELRRIKHPDCPETLV